MCNKSRFFIRRELVRQIFLVLKQTPNSVLYRKQSCLCLVLLFSFYPNIIVCDTTQRKMHFQNIQYFNKLSNQVIRNYLIYSGIENDHHYNCKKTGFPNIGDFDIF